MKEVRFPLARLMVISLAGCLTAAMLGCQTLDFYDPSLEGQTPVAFEPPREMAKMSLPTYRIEPPDLVSIQMMDMIPLEPTRFENGDFIGISLVYKGADFDDFGRKLDRMVINQSFKIELDGTIELPTFGTIRVAGMTDKEVKKMVQSYAIRELAVEYGLSTSELSELLASLEKPDQRLADLLIRWGVAIDDITTMVLHLNQEYMQPVMGVYLVKPDGTVNLKKYGAIYVAGMTLLEAKAAIEKHLQQFFDSPEVWLDVAGYNSKVYYIVTQGAGQGDNITRIPITGNETVLDALAQMRGLSQLSSKNIHIARPAPGGFGCEQILPIDYDAIAYGASTATNYQILPGDRVFVKEDGTLALTNFLGKITGPLERVLGFTSLGSSAIRNMQGLGRGYNRGRYGNSYTQ